MSSMRNTTRLERFTGFPPILLMLIIIPVGVYSLKMALFASQRWNNPTALTVMLFSPMLFATRHSYSRLDTQVLIFMPGGYCYQRNQRDVHNHRFSLSASHCDCLIWNRLCVFDILFEDLRICGNRCSAWQRTIRAGEYIFRRNSRATHEHNIFSRIICCKRMISWTLSILAMQGCGV